MLIIRHPKALDQYHKERQAECASIYFQCLSSSRHIHLLHSYHLAKNSLTL